MWYTLGDNVSLVQPLKLYQLEIISQMYFILFILFFKCILNATCNKLVWMRCDFVYVLVDWVLRHLASPAIQQKHQSWQSSSWEFEEEEELNYCLIKALLTKGKDIALWGMTKTLILINKKLKIYLSIINLSI